MTKREIDIAQDQTLDRYRSAIDELRAELDPESAHDDDHDDDSCAICALELSYDELSDELDELDIDEIERYDDSTLARYARMSAHLT